MSNFYYRRNNNRFPLYSGNLSRRDYPGPFTLTYGGNPPFNTMMFRFIAEDNWQFGRTQFYFGISPTSSFGFTISNLLIWEQPATTWTESTIAAISFNDSYVLPGSEFIICEPEAGSGTLSAGTAYWCSFNLENAATVSLALAGTDISGYLGTHSTNTNYVIRNGPWGTATIIDNLWLRYVK